jgi:disulfide bond formation protein DsbB
LSVIRHWAAPFAVMAVTAFALGVLLNASRIGEAGYFAVLMLYSIVCGAYIAYHVDSEDKPKSKRDP